MVQIIDTYVPVQGGAIFQPESDPEQNFCLSSGQAENQVRFYNNIIFNKALHMRLPKNFEIMSKIFVISDPIGYFLNWHSYPGYNYVGQMDFRQPFYIHCTVLGAGNPSWQIRISTCTVSISEGVVSPVLTHVIGARRQQQSLLAQCVQLVEMTHKCCRCANRVKHTLVKKFGKHHINEDLLYLIENKFFSCEISVFEGIS
jgi:hypothetical protein